MAMVYVVVDRLKDWEPYYPSQNLITFEQYVELGPEKSGPVMVINLCRSYKYLSRGYYTALMAEARGHKVIPSVKAINDLRQKAIYGLQIEDFEPALNKIFIKQKPSEIKEFSLDIFFGRASHPEFSDLGWKIFEAYPFPILNVRFVRGSEWHVSSIRPGSIHLLGGKGEDQFAEALEKFDAKVWRKPRQKKQLRYDLAILCNADEKMPPSNKGAIQRLIRAAKEYNIYAEVISKRDLSRIGEYDGLFIRETTGINHYTYTFSRAAESEGLVVIDSPSSIVRCGNKVYLHELLASNKIKTPKTFVLDEDKVSSFLKERQLEFPMVLKVPDGSFSMGIYKVDNESEFRAHSEELFEKSVLILAQEYMYTEFDWRIGVLNKKPLYSCRYMMSKNHWQIIRRKKAKKGKR